MSETPSRAMLFVVAAVVAAVVGSATAFLVIQRLPPPEAPGPGTPPPPQFDAEKENAELRERVNTLQAELAEARINLATIRAFPKHNPAIQAGAALADPAPELLDGLTEGEKGKFLSLLASMREEAAAAAAEARADFETQELRARLGRAPSTMNLPPEKMERLVAVLREGSDEIRSFGGAPGAARDETALRKRVEEIGRETRARLMDFLSPEEIDAVDAVLSPPAPPGNGDR